MDDRLDGDVMTDVEQVGTYDLIWLGIIFVFRLGTSCLLRKCQWEGSTVDLHPSRRVMTQAQINYMQPSDVPLTHGMPGQKCNDKLLRQRGCSLK